jgi:hypothetical protein
VWQAGSRVRLYRAAWAERAAGDHQHANCCAGDRPGHHHRPGRWGDRPGPARADSVYYGSAFVGAIALRRLVLGDRADECHGPRSPPTATTRSLPTAPWPWGRPTSVTATTRSSSRSSPSSRTGPWPTFRAKVRLHRPATGAAPAAALALDTPLAAALAAGDRVTGPWHDLTTQPATARPRTDVEEPHRPADRPRLGGPTRPRSTE